MLENQGATPAVPENVQRLSLNPAFVKRDLRTGPKTIDLRLQAAEAGDVQDGDDRHAIQDLTIHDHA
jgi:hypothetical protein